MAALPVSPDVPIDIIREESYNILLYTWLGVLIVITDKTMINIHTSLTNQQCHMLLPPIEKVLI